MKRSLGEGFRNDVVLFAVEAMILWKSKVEEERTGEDTGLFVIASIQERTDLITPQAS